MIYIVIPVFNRWNYTRECLISLNNQTNKTFEVIVVDHGSSDGTSKFIKQEFSSVILLNGDSSMWWTAATNMGVKFALEQKNVKFVLTLNNDLIVQKDYIDQLYEASQKKPGSIIGSISLDIDQPEKVVYAGTRWNQLTAKYSIPAPLNIPYSIFKVQHEFIETDLLPGRGTLIPSEIFKKIGLFDENNFPHYVADEEFVLRAHRNGVELYLYSKAAVLSHIALTGLNNPLIKRQGGFSHFREAITSIRSPNNINVRWNWSKKSKYPLLHFGMDMSRLLVSKILKKMKLK